MLLLGHLINDKLISLMSVCFLDTIIVAGYTTMPISCLYPISSYSIGPFCVNISGLYEHACRFLSVSLVISSIIINDTLCHLHVHTCDMWHPLSYPNIGICSSIYFCVHCKNMHVRQVAVAKYMTSWSLVLCNCEVNFQSYSPIKMHIYFYRKLYWYFYTKTCASVYHMVPTELQTIA